MLRKYLVALTDQSVASAFAFVLVVVLIRIWEPESFGIFAFWQAILILVIGVQNALINMPLNIFLPACQSKEEKEDIESVIASVNTLFVVLVVVATLVTSPMLPGISSNTFLASVISAAFLSSGLIREYARSRSFGRQQPSGAFRINSVGLLISSSVFVVAVVTPNHLDLPLLFGVLSLAAFIAGVFGLERLGGRNSRLLFPIKLSVYQPIWIQARWALVGVITTNIQARGYVYLITATAGLEALALVAAAEIVFRPVGLLVTAWGRVSQPRLAELAGHNDIDEYYRIVRYALGILLLANLTLAIGLYNTWATVESLLYGERYEDIGYLVIGWGIVVFIASIRAIFSSCLQALKKFRPLATATIVGSAVFLSSALFVLAFLGFRFILISLISAELVTLICVLAAFFKYRPSANLQYAAAAKSCAT